MSRYTRWLIRRTIRALERELAKHTKVCEERHCRKADLDNCDPTSFCADIREVYVMSFDLSMLLEDQA